MDKKEFKEYASEMRREKGLIMSRVPKKTRALFTSLADEYFCGDYGLTLKQILDDSIIYKTYFENVDMKLDILANKLDEVLDLVQNNEKKNEEIEPEGTKMLNGKSLQRR